MASTDDPNANGARLSCLLIDKGTEAMRIVFDSIHPPATLTATLNSWKSFLQGLRCINQSQLEILFPASGVPSQSKDFDITLVFVLLRNICGLHPPTSTGSWNANPPSSDSSREANLARIKYYRNKVYGHITTTGVGYVNFQSYWNEISAAVVGLGVSEDEVKKLKFAPLEEGIYLDQIKEWQEQEDKFVTLQSQMLENNKQTRDELSFLSENISKLQRTLEKVVQVKKPSYELLDTPKNMAETKNLKSQSDVFQQFVKCDFKADIESLGKLFHPGTREWLLSKLDRWLGGGDFDSRVMILIGGRGVGKSVVAAKVCQVYKKRGQLAACHFCKFNYSDYSDPHKMVHSLSSHMCENVPGFREKLTEQLQRDHSRDTVTDAFRVLLKEPLNALSVQLPKLIVIDALDESEAGGKSELLDLIAQEFSVLPRWIKIFITSRPELPVQLKLRHLDPIEILPMNKENAGDIMLFLESCLSPFGVQHSLIKGLVKQCDGSFKLAYHVQAELIRSVKAGKLREDMIIDEVISQSKAACYEKHFRRLEEELKKLPPNVDVERVSEVLVATQCPLPLGFLAEILELPGEARAMRKVIRRVNESLSTLLLAYDDCVTAVHNTVVGELGDWELV